MSDSTELLTLRLALLATIFVFVLVTALVLRGGLRVRPSAPARARRRAGSARLVVEGAANTGLRLGDEFPLAGETTIGRDAGNGIVLADVSISGRHAAIARDRDGFSISDLGSTNGTLVDGTPIDGRGLRLRGGEQVVLGAVVLRYKI